MSFYENSEDGWHGIYACLIMLFKTILTIDKLNWGLNTQLLQDEYVFVFMTRNPSLFLRLVEWRCLTSKFSSNVTVCLKVTAKNVQAPHLCSSTWTSRMWCTTLLKTCWLSPSVAYLIVWGIVVICVDTAQRSVAFVEVHNRWCSAWATLALTEQSGHSHCPCRSSGAR